MLQAYLYVVLLRSYQGQICDRRFKRRYKLCHAHTFSQHDFVSLHTPHARPIFS